MTTNSIRGNHMSRDRELDLVIGELRARVRDGDREVERLRAALRESRMAGIAIGVLLARTPGWTEQDATAAWERACEQLTRDGHTEALASYVVQTGTLPGEGVVAKA